MTVDLNVSTQAGAARLDTLNLAGMSGEGGDIVKDLGSIRPAHRSRTSRLSDFVHRRTPPPLRPEEFALAQRAHQSRVFRRGRQGGGEAHSGETSDRRMKTLVDQLRPGSGQARDVFDRAKKFATTHPDEVAALLNQGEVQCKAQLKAAFTGALMGDTRAAERAKLIYTAFMAQAVQDQATERQQYYEAALQALGRGGAADAQLMGLRRLQAELAQDLDLSKSGRAQVKLELDRMLAVTQRAAYVLQTQVNASLAGVTVDTPVKGRDPRGDRDSLTARLSDLHKTIELIEASTHLEPSTLADLLASASKAQTFLETLKTREQDLAALADRPALQEQLQRLKAEGYVEARQALTGLKSRVPVDWQEPLLDRLNTEVTAPDKVRWLSDMHAGDAGIIDMVLEGAEWDAPAYALKREALNAPSELALINLHAQHELRKVARELDSAMQGEAEKSTLSSKFKGEQKRLPSNAFRALKADTALIEWFQRAPKTLASRDLAIASWIRLSLHDEQTGQPDPAKCEELFGKLRARGLDTAQIELHAKQGFRSSADVLKCAEQIKAFGRSLQNSGKVFELDAHVRATHVGLQLLERLGVGATRLDDPRIDDQLRTLLERTAHLPASEKKNLHEALMNVAILQVGVERDDPTFTPGGRNGATSYASLIFARLLAMGADAAIATSLVQTLHKDTRTLDALSGAFDPTSKSNRLKSAFGARAYGAKTAQGNVPAGVPASAEQVRRQANEATLHRAFDGLRANQACTITFGTTVSASAGSPIVPGASLNVEVGADVHDSICVAHNAAGDFSVELLAGAAVREGTSLTTLMDAVNFRLGVSHGRDRGYRLTFDKQEDCRDFLVAMANGGDVLASLGKARVEAVSQSTLQADARMDATADLTVASITASLQGSAGESRSVHEMGSMRREVFSRQVGAQAQISASLAGDLASAQATSAIQLGVRRSVVRDHHVLAGGALAPTLSMVAVVAPGKDNVQRCIATLLPWANEQERQAFQAKLGPSKVGDELFIQYQMNEPARIKANLLLGQARRLLDQPPALRSTQSSEQARDLVKSAEAIARDPKNYDLHRFGYTQRSSNTSKGSLGEYAQQDTEDTRFIQPAQLPGNAAAAGKPVFLTVMA